MKQLSTLLLILCSTSSILVASPGVHISFSEVAGVYTWKSADQFKTFKISERGTVVYTSGKLTGSREQIEKRRILKIKYGDAFTVEKEKFWHCFVEDDNGGIVASILFPDSFSLFDPKKCYFLKDEDKKLVRYQRQPPESL